MSMVKNKNILVTGGAGFIGSLSQTINRSWCQSISDCKI